MAKTTEIKLTPKQKEIIFLMRDGWELKETPLAKVVCHLVKRGKPKTVPFPSYQRLLRLGLIDVRKENTFLFVGKLTELGKSIKL